MKKQQVKLPLLATDSIPTPGDFPIGSIESRAAARRQVQASIEGRVRTTFLWMGFGQKNDQQTKARIGPWVENPDGSLTRTVFAPLVMDEEDTLEIFGTKKNPRDGQMGFYGIHH
jgi:hypothetical protein